MGLPTDSIFDTLIIATVYHVIFYPVVWLVNTITNTKLTDLIPHEYNLMQIIVDCLQTPQETFVPHLSWHAVLQIFDKSLLSEYKA